MAGLILVMPLHNIQLKVVAAISYENLVKKPGLEVSGMGERNHEVNQNLTSPHTCFLTNLERKGRNWVQGA